MTGVFFHENISSSARAIEASGVGGLLFCSYRLTWASWRFLLKLMKIIFSSLAGSLMYALLASVGTSQKNAAIVWSRCCLAVFGFARTTSTLVVFWCAKSCYKLIRLLFLCYGECCMEMECITVECKRKTILSIVSGGCLPS